VSSLDVVDVTAGYGKLPIVNRVSFRAGPGQVVSMVGPNGSGKSTLMKAAVGLLKADTGKVMLGERDVANLSSHLVMRAGLGYVPQVQNVFPSLTVRENLLMGAYTRKSGVLDRIAWVYEIIPDLKLADRKRAGALSGGQRNLLGMARAMMLDPIALILDEPSAGLSPKYAAVVWEQVKRIAATGTAMVVVEQNVDLAFANSDWIYLLVAGRNRLDGTPQEVQTHDISALFLGAANEGATTGGRVQTGEKP
jgi:ABC-type branched-subunit amino acid transport system ATPase component